MCVCVQCKECWNQSRDIVHSHWQFASHIVSMQVYLSPLSRVEAKRVIGNASIFTLVPFHKGQKSI